MIGRSSAALPVINCYTESGGGAGMTRIDLGLAGSTRIGRLSLDPARRTISRDDGMQEIVEPRVMQVLLALADERGAIVRREELTERCWSGRIVGEDAITR